MDWLTVAKRLDIGSSTRISCCREDKSAIVSSSLQGWSYYCFRCGTKKFEKNREGISPKQFVAHFFSEEERIVKKCTLPADFTQNIPEHGLLWLRKAGIDADLRHIYKIGYSNSKRRVILQVIHNNELVYMQQRAIMPDQEPKYLNISAKKKPIFRSKMAKGSSVVITEDILSAIKVGQIAPAISILGTKVVDGLLPAIEEYKEVFVWLDGDAAGIKGAIKVAQFCSLSSKPVYIVRTDKDPKYYSKKEIITILKKARENDIRH